MISNKTKRQIGQALVEWYDQNKRALPWRQTKDPYYIWLSEIILQQTRINQGLPYYEKFVDAFPDVCALAQADLSEVLRLWQGLGYYTRARNLHLCAIQICDEHDGKFPDTYDALIKLPGIGPYTAAAIASIAYGVQVPAIDGNALRVMTRLTGVDADISKQSTISMIRDLTKSMMLGEPPATFNQALMEFGALHCTPANPNCETCTLKQACKAQKTGTQHLLPFKQQKNAKRHRYFYYMIIRDEENIYLRKRTQKDIWNGLYEFFLIEQSKNYEIDKIIDFFLSEVHPDCQIVLKDDHYFRHILTHQIIHATFIDLEIRYNALKKILHDRGYKPYTIAEIQQLPKPILIARYLQEKII